MCNMISIEELPEGYDEDLVVQADPVLGALMMVSSQPRRSFQKQLWKRLVMMRPFQST